MRASYSSSHICTHVCIHSSALPCALPRRPLLLSLHHACAHACSRMPLAPSAHAYAHVCVHVKHMLRSAGEKGGIAADTLSTHQHLSTCPPRRWRMWTRLRAKSQAECGMCERAREKTRQAGRHEERQQCEAMVTPPSREMERMYVCACVYLSLFFAPVHMTDRGCQRHAYMPCMQAAQVSMCASYSNSHICTYVCICVPALRAPAVILVALAASCIRACMQ